MEDLEEGLYRYRATCWKVVDGDTVDLDIDMGLRVFSRQRMRLLGLDAPEIYGVKEETEEFGKALDATRELVRLLKPNHLGHGLDRHISPYLLEGKPTHLWVETVKDKTGKYGRFLVNVWVWWKDEVLFLNKHLIDKGFAKKVIY
jgi:micrococcal nuclease